MLDLFQNGQQEQLQNAKRNPANSTGAGFDETFDAAWDVNKRFNSVMANRTNLADAAQTHLDMYESQTGERLPNPYRLGFNPLGWDVGEMAEKLKRVRDATENAATKLNKPDLVFPAGDVLQRSADNLGKQALAKQARVGEGAQNFGSGIAPLAADMGSMFENPASLAINTLAMGAMPEGGLIKALLGSAAAFGAQGATEEALTFATKQRINPEWGVGDAVTSTLEQAAMGPVFELGGRAVGALWRRLRTMPEPAKAAPGFDKSKWGITQEITDAGNAAERKADLEANNPFKTGPVGSAAHHEAVSLVEDALMNDRPLPDLPNARAEASVTPQQQLAALDRHVAEKNPDLFGRVNDLEQSLAQARAEIARITDAPQASGGGALVNRIAALEKEFEVFTGKRRSSPAGKALRSEIEGLRNQSAALDTADAARSADRVRFLRERIVDLTYRRADIGLEVSSAREAASREIGVPFERGGRLDPSPSASGNPFRAEGGKVVDDALAHPSPEVQKVGAALTDAAPGWKKMQQAVEEGQIPAAHDITKDLMQAVSVVMQAINEGRPVSELLAHGDAFASDMAGIAARLFYKDGELKDLLPHEKIVANLDSLAQKLSEPPKAIEPPAKQVKSGQSPERRAAISSVSSAKELEKAATDPKVHEAMQAQLVRNMEQGKNRVPVERADGTFELGFVDKELHDLDAQLALSKEIEACAIPMKEAAE